MKFNLKSVIKGIGIVFILILFSNISNAQSYKRHEAVLAYLYQFPKHIEWKNEDQYDNFHFLVATEDQELINNFKKVSEALKIKNKPVKITTSSEANINLSDIRIIFISNDKVDLYLDVFDKIEGKEILIISDSYMDKRFVMINMYDSGESNLVFEINKANIINQNLSISDEILLLGGNLIDVAELYRKSQQSLRGMEKNLRNYEQILDSLNREMSLIKQEIENQKKEIIGQKQLIDNQKLELEKQLIEIEEHKRLVLEQKYVLNQQKDSIQKQSDALTATQKQLNIQKQEILDGKEVLNQQKAELTRMDSEIGEKTKILREQDITIGEQDITISRQRQIMILFIIVIILIIGLTISIFRAYRSNRKKNIILNNHKVEIEKINEELKTSNEELFQKNEEISVTLEKLKETQGQLVQSEKMASLGILTAGIAHEINNPINFVYTGVNSLKKDFQDVSHVLNEINEISPENLEPTEFFQRVDNLKEKYYFSEAYEAIINTIQHIELGAKRTADIVRGLRNFSRMEKEEWQQTDIHSNINDVLILLKNKYKHHIQIVKDFESDLPKIECYAGKINQVLLNIISNSIDAIKESGEIIIKTESVGKYIQVLVKDNGGGINENDIAKIFDPFFTTKEVGKGIGLGLSISYGIIKEHNGEINVKTEPGKGTLFIIKLPTNQKHN